MIQTRPDLVRNAAALPSGATVECVTRRPTWRIGLWEGVAEEMLVGSVKEPPHSASTVLAGKVLQKMWRLSGKRIALERVSAPGPWEQLGFCITYRRGGGVYFSDF